MNVAADNVTKSNHGAGAGAWWAGLAGVVFETKTQGVETLGDIHSILTMEAPSCDAKSPARRPHPSTHPLSKDP